MTKYNKNKSQNGYISLISTIFITLILLVVMVEESRSGLSARLNILGTEAKEEANALAEGCLEDAKARILADPSFLGNTDIITGGGTCHIFPIQFDNLVTHTVTIKSQAVVRNSYANLKVIMYMNDIHLYSAPEAATGAVAPSPNLNFDQNSWQEIPTAS